MRTKNQGPNHNWTSAELDTIRSMYASSPKDEITATLSLSWNVIRKKANHLGLLRDKAKIYGSRKCHEVGSKGLYPVKGKMYWFVVTAPSQRELLHRVLFKEANGSLKPNQVLKCVNGDTTDARPENWAIWKRTPPPTSPPKKEPLAAKLPELQAMFGNVTPLIKPAKPLAQKEPAPRRRSPSPIATAPKIGKGAGPNEIASRAEKKRKDRTVADLVKTRKAQFEGMSIAQKTEAQRADKVAIYVPAQPGDLRDGVRFVRPQNVEKWLAIPGARRVGQAI